MMETTYYTFTAHEIVAEGETVAQASGDGLRRTVYLRRTAPLSEGAGKVIDLAAWRTQDLPDETPEDYMGPEAPVEPAEAEQPRQTAEDRRQAALMRGELAATLGVICVLAALLIRVLAF